MRPGRGDLAGDSRAGSGRATDRPEARHNAGMCGFKRRTRGRIGDNCILADSIPDIRAPANTAAHIDAYRHETDRSRNIDNVADCQALPVAIPCAVTANRARIGRHAITDNNANRFDDRDRRGCDGAA